MKCPNCNAEIKDGMLYCEKCGAELELVSDDTFSYDLENIDFDDDTSSKKDEDDISLDFDDDPNLISILLSKRKNSKFIYAAVALALIVCVVFVIVFVVNYSRQNSYSYQLKQATEKYNDNDLTGAITSLEKAYKIEPSSDLLFTIADYYYTLSRENDAVYTLVEITEGEFPASEKETAYRKIISVYKESENYALIAEILKTCTIPEIITEFNDYCVFSPMFNAKEGDYDETVALKISSDGKGEIHYTLDNSTPNSESEVYTSPIFLESGKYTVNAVYINPYGVSSDIVTKQYQINADYSFEPDILTESGTYTEATLIEADVPSLFTLYYTTDGSEPSKASTKYISPIPMKEGTTTYKFVSYASDGTKSDVVERKYTLDLEANYTAAEAVSALTDHLVAIGYLTDGVHKPDVSGNFYYYYSAIYPIEDFGSFYFVVEYYEDAAGNITNTSTIFAVSVKDLSIYKVTASGNGNYSLSAY